MFYSHGCVSHPSQASSHESSIDGTLCSPEKSSQTPSQGEADRQRLLWVGSTALIFYRFHLERIAFYKEINELHTEQFREIGSVNHRKMCL